MRDTSRLQCIALLLLGASAWFSLDLGSLRTALGNVLNPAEKAAPADPGLDATPPVVSRDAEDEEPFQRLRFKVMKGPRSKSSMPCWLTTPIILT